jgi:hypothetical protein
MQSGSSPVLDANAAHPPEIRENDPRHLGNLTKKMNSLNGQVSADTKYDPAPPPRVDQDGNPVTETFVSELPPSTLKIYGQYIYAFGALSLIILVAILVCVLDSRLRTRLFGQKWTANILILTSVVCIVTIAFCYKLHRQMKMDLWYPRYN